MNNLASFSFSKKGIQTMKRFLGGDQVGRYLKIGVIQNKVTKSHEDTFSNALKLVDQAGSQGAKLIVLGESFLHPYDMYILKRNRTSISESVACHEFSMLAKKHQATIVGGTIPEKIPDDPKHIYNTSVVFSPFGTILGKYRKIHMFDVEVQGQVTYKESDHVRSGQELGVFGTTFGNLGVIICHDLRFAELSLLYRKLNCNILVVPACFSMFTGQRQWSQLLAARALDLQSWVIGVSAARDKEDVSFVRWAKSEIVDPWGRQYSKLGINQDMSIVTIDLEQVEIARNQIPIHQQKRGDLYKLIKLASSKYTKKYY
ncbi:nitrilase-related [Anaeramoeba flamelloides]|uniref:Nitrilase-related n=1 Tax=Anaeramoeba flamelloides TaxID=1746091 RepID=A0AAV7YL18_9EUKA|nr:nitrilase-related [Anaeramoeba flamelloides]